MKVRISDLTHSGLEISESMSLEALNERMSAARGNDIVFTQAPKVQISITKMEGGAEVSGEVTSRYTQPCSRCADDIDRDHKVSLHLLLQEAGVKAPVTGEREEDVENSLDDVGLTFFEGDSIELDELIQEQMILSLDSVYRPACDKKGNCSICGKNPKALLGDEPAETTTKLGDLLSLALKKNGVKK